MNSLLLVTLKLINTESYSMFQTSLQLL